MRRGRRRPCKSTKDDVKKKLIENTSNAVARGSFGSPTFYVGDEIFFGKDRLREVEEEIVAQLAAKRRKTA
jgi:2-hydroxychromene-2-carboxylate isomerase